MGRKSNAKKAVRELLDEREEKEKKKILAKLAKKSKIEQEKELKKLKKKEKPKKQKKLKKAQIFSGILSLIMIGILFWIGAILFDKALRAKPIAKFLAADSTVLTLDLNINFEHLQNLKSFMLLEKYPEYSHEALIEFIEKTFFVNFQIDIEPWLGRQASIAIIETDKEEKTLATLYFVEVFSKKAAKEFFGRTAKLSQYKGFDFMSFDADPLAPFLIDNPLFERPKYLVFMDNYIVATADEEALHSLIDSIINNDAKLYDSDKYRRIDDNTPMQKLGFLYIDFEKAAEDLLKYFPELTEGDLSLVKLKPFIDLLSTEGISFIAKDDKFAIQSFITLDKGDLKDETFIAMQEKYQARLLDFISSETLVFWGAKNLDYQLEKVTELFPFADTFVKSLAEKYLGEEIDLDTDIMPLLRNEYAIGIEKIEGKNVYKLILELGSSDDQEKVHKLIEAFISMAAGYKQEIVTYTLEDGTVSQEIMAVPEKIVKNETDFNGNQIYSFEFADNNMELAYTFLDNVTILSTDIEGVKNSIKAIDGEILSLKKSGIYLDIIEPILRNSDEISYFNLEKLFPNLKAFSRLSSGKNYFNDGIMTINFLSLK